MTAQILKQKTRNNEQPFYLSIKIWCYFIVFYVFFCCCYQSIEKISNTLMQFSILMQYYKLVFKGKSEGDDAFFFFAFIYNFHIAIAQGFGRSACISASHSEPLVTIVTV